MRFKGGPRHERAYNGSAYSHCWFFRSADVVIRHPTAGVELAGEPGPEELEGKLALAPLGAVAVPGGLSRSPRGCGWVLATRDLGLRGRSVSGSIKTAPR